MRYAKKAAALLLAFAFTLGMAGCKKKEDPGKEEIAWFDSKTVDIALPYNESEYNSLVSKLAGCCPCQLRKALSQ